MIYMFKIVYHTQFKKDYKKIIKRGYQEKLFVEVLHYLVEQNHYPKNIKNMI